MLDVTELERTLDLWATMWTAEEKAQFERAVERIVDGDGPLNLKAAAVAACRIIATPRLLGAVERADWLLEDDVLEEIEAIARPRARLLRHAERLAHDRAGVAFLVDKAVREPGNPVADKLLDRVDIRDLYTVMSTSFDDELRLEAARRIARRGPRQRARLQSALDLPIGAFDDALAVDVPLDDLADEMIADDAWLPTVDVVLAVSA